MSLWSVDQREIPMPCCFICETHCILCALALAAVRAGSSIAARMAIIAITTSSSINVNADQFRPAWFFRLVFKWSGIAVLLVDQDNLPLLADGIFFPRRRRRRRHFANGHELIEA